VTRVRKATDNCTIAGRLRSQLTPLRTSYEVAAILGLSHQGVVAVEKRALTKIFWAMKDLESGENLRRTA
jgi:transcriptional regulator